jgi:CelD/BcsL family acetyltransferase involved in cellulose biosynthesis
VQTGSVAEWHQECDSPAEIVAIYEINPLNDRRWDLFLERHDRASLFHSTRWLEALHQTYQFEPIALTTAPPDKDLEDAIVFCRVESFLTGRRLVSIPFSDHCDPLLSKGGSFENFIRAIEADIHRNKLKYAEIRPTYALQSAAMQPASLMRCWHRLDLTPSLDTIFRSCHKDSVQRKIRRAEREGLRYEEGQSPELFEAFWRLYVLTRRRHQVPPQPRKWFYNLLKSFGESMKIRVVAKGQATVAAIITIQYKDTLVYKYGGSDRQFNNLGGTHLLFWRSIQEAKGKGLNWFDLGRSEYANEGLVTFKDRWGAQSSQLVYARIGAPTRRGNRLWETRQYAPARFTKRIVSHLPDRIFHFLGSLLYKHFA